MHSQLHALDEARRKHEFFSSSAVQPALGQSQPTERIENDSPRRGRVLVCRYRFEPVAKQKYARGRQVDRYQRPNLPPKGPGPTSGIGLSTAFDRDEKDHPHFFSGFKQTLFQRLSESMVPAGRLPGAWGGRSSIPDSGETVRHLQFTSPCPRRIRPNSQPRGQDIERRRSHGRQVLTSF